MKATTGPASDADSEGPGRAKKAQKDPGREVGLSAANWHPGHSPSLEGLEH